MIERKNIDFEALTFKASDDDEMIVEGYATTFGNKDSDGDIIEKGTFGTRLTAKKVKFLNQHDMRSPIGVITELKEDDNGIYMKAKFSNTTMGRDVYTLAKDGAIDAFSIGFTITKGGFDYRDGIRYITKGKLMEVSAVTFPANEKAKITNVKSSDEKLDKRDFEGSLEYIGFSQKEARIIVSKAYPALESHWDGDCEDKDNQCDADVKKAVNEKAVKDLLKILKGN